jgi:hypothetical protein
MTHTIANSQEAKSAFKKHQLHYDIILETLDKFGIQDSLQISKKCILSYHQVARRMGELRDSGKIYEHSKHKLEGYKSNRTVWALTTNNSNN